MCWIWVVCKLHLDYVFSTSIMKVLQRPRGPGIPRGEFKNLTVRPRGTKSNLTVRILQVTMRYLLVSQWGLSWSPWGSSCSHREVPFGRNEEPPGERKIRSFPYQEGTSWSHGEVSQGHHEVPLGPKGGCNAAPPATPHRPLYQKWLTGSRNRSNLRLLDPPINFR